MHYPLHITVLCAALWILRGDVNAAKAGVSPEVLTSFAKNIASVLSTTLLGELRDTRGNQTELKLSGPLKKLLEVQPFHADDVEVGDGRFLEGAPRDRAKRLVGDRGSPLVDDQRRFRNIYGVPDTVRYPKPYGPEAYRFPVNPGPESPRGEAIVGPGESSNVDERGNAVDGDVNLHYASEYQQPTGFKYKPDLVHPLVPPPNNYLPLFRQYHHRDRHPQTSGPGEQQPSGVADIDANEGPNDDPQPARDLAERPYNLNYQDPYNTPGPSAFGNSGDLYQQVHPPANGQTEDEDGQSPASLTEDQNQKGGYLYPSFHYGPFHNGFYGPHYDGPGPYYNDSYHGGNNSGHYGGPYSGPRYNDYGPYSPYEPYYPRHRGYGRPDHPQNGPENGQNAAQAEGENANANGNNNGPGPGHGYNHGNGHGYGYGHGYGPGYGHVYGPGYGPGYGPFYGGGPFAKYSGFPVFPYKPYHHGFFEGPYKAPYIHDPFLPFPLGPYYPFHGFYHYGPYGPKSDKQDATTTEKTKDESAAANPNAAEVVSEGQSELVEALASNQQLYFPLALPVAVRNTKCCEEHGSTAGDA